MRLCSGHQLTCCWTTILATAASASSTTARSSANEQLAAAGWGRSSNARSGRSCWSSSVRSRRRSRLRTTAPPTCLPIANPTSGTAVGSPTTTVKGPRRTRVPLADRRLKMRRPRSGRVVDPMGRWPGPASGREPGATLGAPSLQNGSPARCGHTSTETVLLCPPTSIWLECALHRDLRDVAAENSEEDLDAHGAEPENDSSEGRSRFAGVCEVRAGVTPKRGRPQGATVPAADVSRDPVFPPGSQKLPTPPERALVVSTHRVSTTCG